MEASDGAVEPARAGAMEGGSALYTCSAMESRIAAECARAIATPWQSIGL